MTIARRSRLSVVLLLLALGLLAPATPASAAVETFLRFEEVATANWLVTEQCENGNVSRTQVTVLAGREFESPDLDDVNIFGTVRIRTIDCEGNFTSDFGTGPVTYTSSPSLQEAHVTGTVPLSGGGEATIDVTWEATSGIETTINQSQFPGFVGIFTSKRRDAVATGTVSVNGVPVVSGPATSAEIETLEDRNKTLPSSE